MTAPLEGKVAAVDAAVAEFGGIDILVANAGQNASGITGTVQRSESRTPLATLSPNVYYRNAFVRDACR